MEDQKMKWHCKNCGRDFEGAPNRQYIKIRNIKKTILICPFCNSKIIENIPDSDEKKNGK
jgi:DNA-directed RNA polymerase subunit RPC12/RpoP